LLGWLIEFNKKENGYKPWREFLKSEIPT